MFKSLSHRISLLGYSARAVGPARMLRHSWRWASDGEARNVDSGFDDEHGTDTNAELTPAEACIPAGRRRSATMYLPTMDEDLHALLDALAWPTALVERASFVDLGSGKGRAVLLAAMRAFREVIGVELSPVLHEVAANNLRLMSDSNAITAPVRLVQGDAAEYEVPSGPVLTYMYHPFRAEVARLALGRLADSLRETPRPAAVLYCHPTLQQPFPDDVFEQDGVLQHHAEGARKTRRYKVGWSVWTNYEWLSLQGGASAE